MKHNLGKLLSSMNISAHQKFTAFPTIKSFNFVSEFRVDDGRDEAESGAGERTVGG